jgi:spore coat-associated protein N
MRPPVRFVLLAILAIVVPQIGATSSLLTTSASPGVSMFTTGSVIIGTDPATVALQAQNMALGDSVVRSVTVTNGGSLQLRYAITSTVTGSSTLAAGLQLTVWDENAEADQDLACASTPPGTKLYSAGVIGSTSATTNIVGNVTQGAQTGDQTLNAGATQQLCLLVALPSNASSSLASQSLSATFTWNAEQTAHN